MYTDDADNFGPTGLFWTGGEYDIIESILMFLGMR